MERTKLTTSSSSRHTSYLRAHHRPGPGPTRQRRPTAGPTEAGTEKRGPTDAHIAIYARVDGGSVKLSVRAAGGRPARKGFHGIPARRRRGPVREYVSSVCKYTCIVWTRTRQSGSSEGWLHLGVASGGLTGNI